MLSKLPAAPLSPTRLAAELGVIPDIHPDDFIYQWEHEKSGTSKDQVLEQYLRSGRASAEQLDAIVQNFREKSAGPTSLLEFASGYGCVTRHLKNMADRYDLVACDIHQQAVDFLRQSIGVDAALSHADPEQLTFEKSFDVVFALSFFTHLPHRTFRQWLGRLLSVVSDGGLLIFTTSGRAGHRFIDFAPLNDDGYWFAPMSEQKDLPVEDYGATIAMPRYVIAQLASLPKAVLVFYQEAFWWGFQDVYIVQKRAVTGFTAPIFPPVSFAAASLQTRLASLESEIAALRASSSWRLTAPLRKLTQLIRGG